VIVICRGGPFDGTRWDYPEPLPQSLVLMERRTHGYHEYGRKGRTHTYVYLSFIGRLQVPIDLDAEEESEELEGS
jgi:hypothetical protein